MFDLLLDLAFLPLLPMALTAAGAGAAGGSALASTLLPAAIGAAGTIGASALSARASAQQAGRQMDFQREMSDTSYQRAMADMKLAGLNPILAYKQGGASTPPGAMGQVPDFGKAGAAGAQAAIQMQHAAATISNLHQQNHNIQEQTRDLRLRNDAWERLPELAREIALVGAPVSSAVTAAHRVGGMISRNLPWNIHKKVPFKGPHIRVPNQVKFHR